MFETSFQHSSSTPIPSDVSISQGLSILHDFETVVRLSPDCCGCRQLPPSEVPNKKSSDHNQDQTQHYEVSDNLPFIPKRLWSGGVKYTADFLPQPNGCIVTVYAPGGFTSVNQWRLLRNSHSESNTQRRPSLPRTASKDLLHEDNAAGEGWYVEIVSDAKCSRTFAGFVKGFLKNNHITLQEAFVEKLRGRSEQVVANGGRERRPTVGRRKSSVM